MAFDRPQRHVLLSCLLSLLIHSYRIGQTIFPQSDPPHGCLADFQSPSFPRERAWNKDAVASVLLDKMRVVLWTYPKGGITDNLSSGSEKSRKGEISVLWHARERVSMKSNDPRHASELCSFCKSGRPMRPR